MVQRFQLIVGSLVTLFNPLTVSGLADLLDTPPWKVENMVQSLNSVLHYSEVDDIQITPLHLSFRDHLLNSQRCDPRFNITEADKHRELAVSCLQLLSARLKMDVCSLGQPGILLSEVDEDVIRKSLPPSVQYACLYWVEHLRRCGDHHSLHGRVYTFLHEHCVHWIEALGLMGRMGEGVRIFNDFESILTVCDISPFILSCFGTGLAEVAGGVAVAGIPHHRLPAGRHVRCRIHRPPAYSCLPAAPHSLSSVACPPASALPVLLRILRGAVLPCCRHQDGRLQDPGKHK